MGRWLTYHDGLQDYIEREVADGGGIDRIAQLILIYQGKDPAGRQQKFDDYALNVTFICKACNASFHRNTVPEEDSYILCESCKLEHHLSA